MIVHENRISNYQILQIQKRVIVETPNCASNYVTGDILLFVIGSPHQCVLSDQCDLCDLGRAVKSDG